jgi:hypothetical protein
MSTRSGERDPPATTERSRDVKDQKRKIGSRSSALGLALALVASVIGLGALTAPVSAQEAPPTADAFAECVEGEGFIQVEIVDDFSTVYNVYIDDVLVDEEVTDSDEGFYTYGPFEDGVYNVRVEWLEDETDILDTDVTVDCVPDETTTTTAAPTTTTTAPAAAAATAAPRFTG